MRGSERKGGGREDRQQHKGHGARTRDEPRTSGHERQAADRHRTRTATAHELQTEVMPPNPNLGHSLVHFFSVFMFK